MPPWLDDAYWRERLKPKCMANSPKWNEFMILLYLKNEWVPSAKAATPEAAHRKYRDELPYKSSTSHKKSRAATEAMKNANLSNEIVIFLGSFFLCKKRALNEHGPADVWPKWTMKSLHRRPCWAEIINNTNHALWLPVILIALNVCRQLTIILLATLRRRSS